MDTASMYQLSDSSASVNQSNDSAVLGGENSTTGNGAPEGYSVPHIILTSILVSVIMFVIVFGNLLVVIAIFTDRQLKTTQNWFIASLAVADFLLGLVIMPFSLANEMMGYWFFGHLWCDLWKAIDVLLCTASILSICLISLDRYWSITRAIQYSRQRTPTRAALMIAAVWGLSAVICVPPLIGWKNPLPVTEYPMCLLSADIGYVLYSTMGSFYIPCVIMVFVYFKIFQAARKLARKNIRKKEKNKAIKTEHQNDLKTKTHESAEKKNGIHPDTITADEFPVVNAEGKTIPRAVIKITNEESKLIITDSDTDSCKVYRHNPEPSNFSINTRKSLSEEENSETSNRTDRSYRNGSVCKEHSDHDHLDTNVVDPNDTNMSTSSLNQDTGGSKSCLSSRKSSKTGTERSSSRLNMRKLSDTLSKKRCRSNSNKGSKGWRASSIREHERQRRKLAKARERRATIVLGLVMAAFILCWFPFFTLYIITSFCDCVGGVVFAVVFWAGYCNSALNPIIYTVFNRDFRQAFYKILCKRFCNRR